MRGRYVKGEDINRVNALAREQAARIAALEAAARALLTDADPARFLANDDAYDRWVRHRAVLAALLEDA